jgi:glycosyltransferase involved in cell wall biosynthesis
MVEYKISIAMCTYNGEKFLKQQLDSIVNQTLKPYEIIISDDCSTDNTVDILKTYQQNHKEINIIILENLTNQGVTGNFEKALLNSTGDIIFLSDQDDIWLLNKIERVVNEFKNKSFNAIFTDAFIIDESSKNQPGTLWDRLNFKSNMRRRFLKSKGIEILLKKDVITGCTLAIKRQFLKEVLPLNKLYIHDAWIGIIFELTNGLGLIDEPLINYRLHASQQIGLNQSREKKGVTFKNRYSNTLIKLSNLIKHVNNLPSLDGLKFEKLNEKNNFYIARSNPNILNILTYFIKGFYFRYSSGLKSAIIDLISALRRNQ